MKYWLDIKCVYIYLKQSQSSQKVSTVEFPVKIQRDFSQVSLYLSLTAFQVWCASFLFSNVCQQVCSDYNSLSNFFCLSYRYLSKCINEEIGNQYLHVEVDSKSPEYFLYVKLGLLFR